MEIWADILEYEDCYQVSNYGNIRSKDRYINSAIKNQNSILRRGQFITIKNGINGYKFVLLYKNGSQKMGLIHRLVAQAFIHNTESKKCINHIDGIKSNNHCKNLEWCSHLENKKHAMDNNLVAKGEICGASKFKDDDILSIRDKKGILSSRKVALMYGTSSSNICDIWNRKTWKHL